MGDLKRTRLWDTDTSSRELTGCLSLVVWWSFDLSFSQSVSQSVSQPASQSVNHFLLKKLLGLMD